MSLRWSTPLAFATLCVCSLLTNCLVAERPGKAELPRVLIIGDSISMGYTPGVKQQLAGQAIVERIPENGRSTEYGLQKLDAWLGAGRWDVIHFNFGLHDLKYVNADGKNTKPANGHPQVALDKYEANLRKLVERLKKTGAKLVFATTTPVPAGAASRVAGDERRYNDAARKVMAAEHIEVNDLHEFAQPRLAKLQNPRDVHFTDAGSAALAVEVAQAIRNQLPAVAERRPAGGNP